MKEECIWRAFKSISNKIMSNIEEIYCFYILNLNKYLFNIKYELE